jgi:hypothetical protein
LEAFTVTNLPTGRIECPAVGAEVTIPVPLSGPLQQGIEPKLSVRIKHSNGFLLQRPCISEGKRKERKGNAPFWQKKDPNLLRKLFQTATRSVSFINGM